MAIKCIITDDEPLARRGLEKYIERISFLELAAVCEDALQLQARLQEQETELIFLDINMPYLSGLEFIRTHRQLPKVVITTAYPEHALEGYELDVLDYLVKPISFQRFFKAAAKAQEYFALASGRAGEEPPGYFFLKCDKRLERIVFAEVLFVESMQNYVRIHTREATYTAHATLKSIAEELPAEDFVQAHKSFIVNVSEVEAIEGLLLHIGNHRVPISKYRKDEVLQRLLNGRLFER